MAHPQFDHIVNAETDAELRAAYAAADLAVADGQWVVWASRILGTPLPAKISGSDLVLPLARAAARSDLSMYLLGATPKVVAEIGAWYAPCEANWGGSAMAILPPRPARGASRPAQQVAVE